MNAKNYFTLPLLAFAVFLSPLQAETIPKDLLAGWSLKLDSGEPAWMRVVEQNGIAIVYMRLHVGPDGPWQVIEVTDGRLKFATDRKRKKNAPHPGVHMPPSFFCICIDAGASSSKVSKKQQQKADEAYAQRAMKRARDDSDPFA